MARKFGLQVKKIYIIFFLLQNKLIFYFKVKRVKIFKNQNNIDKIIMYVIICGLNKKVGFEFHYYVLIVLLKKNMHLTHKNIKLYARCIMKIQLIKYKICFQKFKFLIEMVIHTHTLR